MFPGIHTIERLSNRQGYSENKQNDDASECFKEMKFDVSEFVCRHGSIANEQSEIGQFAPMFVFTMFRIEGRDASGKNRPNGSSQSFDKFNFSSTIHNRFQTK
jgi:hypothetical protein